MNILTNLNLTRNELQNAVIQPLATAPANPKLAQIYYNSTDKLLYQYNGTAWTPIGAVYNQESSTGVVITGLNAQGTVTGTDVIDLTLDGYTPVTGGYVLEGQTLEEALIALDTAVKNAVASGGEVNQNAWSYINVGNTTISANAKTDTFKIATSNPATVSADSSTKTVTIGVDVDTSLNNSSTNPVQNKVINTAISAKYTKPSSGIPKTDLASGIQASLDAADTAVQPAALDAYLPLSGGTMTGNLNMASHSINNIPDASGDAQPVAYGQLPTTPVVTSFELDYDGDTVTINKDYLNVKTGTTSSDDEVIALANGTTAGLMAPSSVNAISNLSQRVEALEGTTVRLLYSTKTNPSAAEIEAFVRAEGYTDPTKWTGIAVVVAETYHIWHYYSGGVGWRDDGVDTVSQWTNSTLGIIKGSTANGQIYAEDDGTGSVNGWDALNTTVTNLGNNKADKTTVNAIPVVKVATGTIGTSVKTADVSYSGTVINTYVKDGSGNECLTDVVISSSSVTFTTAQNPSSALTCTVVYV